MVRIGLALAFSTMTLAACGLRGDLERPVPLFGNPPNEGPSDPRTIKAAEEAAKAEKERQDAERRAQEAQPATPTPATPQ
ncbi:MAG: lipoprotein [Hyphomonadaceae bacterium]|nr:lipoprotein [Hyphomonadaceae bacterium]